jgi:hypothetical protein
MILSSEYLNKLEELDLTVQYMNYKINSYKPKHWTDPEHMNIRRAELNYRKMLQAYRIYEVMGKKTDIGIKLFIKPHNFDGNT